MDTQWRYINASILNLQHMEPLYIVIHRCITVLFHLYCVVCLTNCEICRENFTTLVECIKTALETLAIYDTHTILLH